MIRPEQIKITYIQTLDGRTRIDWWPKELFSGREIAIYTEKGKQSIPVPDESIICDMCNDSIEEFPVPVMGSYALCKSCYENAQIKKNNWPEIPDGEGTIIQWK